MSNYHRTWPSVITHAGNPHTQLLLQGDVVKSGSEGAAAPSKDAHHGDARHGHEHHH